MTSRGAEKMKNDTIGVDVSKDHLDAHRLADGATRRFANTKGGHKALIKWLTETPLYRVVFGYRQVNEFGVDDRVSAGHVDSP